MKLKKIIFALFLFFISFTVRSAGGWFADGATAYSACGSNDGSAASGTYNSYCGSHSGFYDYDTVRCVGNGSYSRYSNGSNYFFCTSSYNACSSGNVREFPSGNCVQPICSSSQNPITSNCHYPIDKGNGINCTDGSTVYVPFVCPVNAWDWLFMPKEGQSATCSNGSVIGFGQSCLDQWFKRNVTDSTNPAVAVGAIIGGMYISGGPKAVLSMVNGILKIDMPLGLKINNTGNLPAVVARSELSTITVGKAVSSYIAANPTSPYAVGLVNALASSPSAITATINVNTGLITPSGSSVPLSSNQLGQIAIASHGTNPLPLTELAPFVQPELMPWLEPSLTAIEGEFTRYYEPYSVSPLNFPGVTKAPLYLSTTDFLPAPVLSVSPQSPQSFSPYISPASSTLPSPLANPNPLANDQTSYLPPTAPPGDVIPTSGDIIPVSPSLYPDTWKYFEFMKTSNPFSFDPRQWLPVLPEPVCTYEIHQIVHVPFMGNHAFNVAPCALLAPLRAVLKWAFAVLTSITCFFLIFRATFTQR